MIVVVAAVLATIIVQRLKKDNSFPAEKDRMLSAKVEAAIELACEQFADYQNTFIGIADELPMNHITQCITVDEIKISLKNDMTNKYIYGEDIAEKYPKLYTYLVSLIVSEIPYYSISHENTGIYFAIGIVDFTSIKVVKIHSSMQVEEVFKHYGGYNALGIDDWYVVWRTMPPV